MAAALAGAAIPASTVMATRADIRVFMIFLAYCIEGGTHARPP